jgi:hypothetical protein
VYDIFRDWNKKHPDKKLKFACSDIEHYLGTTINFILNPYLKKIDPKLEVQWNDTLQVYLNKAKVLIEQAKKINLIGDYPFQTPAYMESVYENLKSSAPIKMNPKKWQNHADRYKVMIRNVTDTRFLGNDIANGKCIFYGGSDHFKSYDSHELMELKLAKNNYYQTEGNYLANDFEPTKGQMYSINLMSLGYSIGDSIRHIDPRLGYQTEASLIDLLKRNKIKLNEPIVYSLSCELFEYIYKLSYKYPDNAFRIREVDYDEFYKLNYKRFKRFSTIINLEELSRFNTNILIPFSPISDK